MVDLQEIRNRLEEEQLTREYVDKLFNQRIKELLISAQEAAERAQEQGGLASHTPYGYFTEHSPQPILRFNAEGMLEVANPSAIKLLGIRLEEPIAFHTFFHNVSPSDAKNIILHDKLLSLHFDVEDRQYLAYVRGVSRRSFINVYFNDITDLIKIKNQIDADHKKTEQLIQSISSFLIGLDKEGNIMRVNEATESTFGVQFQELKGMKLDDCPIKWSLGTFDLIRLLLEDEKSIVLEDGRFLNAEGEEGYMDVTVTKILNSEATTTGYLILARDTTKRKLLEIQLNQAQKLESIGQLAAGIAHEINTPIQFVGDNTHFLSSAFKRLDHVLDLTNQLVKRYLEGEEMHDLFEDLELTLRKSKIGYMRSEIPNALEESLKGLDQVASIVKGMKQFSHPGTSSKRLSDINSCLTNTITVSRNEWKYVAKLETELADNLPLVLCHTNEINQVFLNMIVNAAHAIEDVKDEDSSELGTITVRTTHENDFVVITISDTGVGIPKEIQDRVFDPFFTTKEPGKGTGQGLAIAHTVIHKHDGSVTLTSEEGIGTTFSIRLPAHK